MPNNAALPTKATCVCGVFFALWIFMVLLLLADFSARVLRGSRRLLLGMPLLLGARGCGAGFCSSLMPPPGAARSDLAGSAQILCQTPLDPRLVALEWMIEGWVEALAGSLARRNRTGLRPDSGAVRAQIDRLNLPAYLLAGALPERRRPCSADRRAGLVRRSYPPARHTVRRTCAGWLRSCLR